MQWTEQRDDWEPDCIQAVMAANDSWKEQLGIKYQEDKDWDGYVASGKKADQWLVDQVKRLQQNDMPQIPVKAKASALP